MSPFEVVHETRQHADYAAVFSQRRVRQMPHRADAAGAVNQRHLVARQLAPEPGGGVMILGVALTTRRAINTNSLDNHRAIVPDRFAPIQTAGVIALANTKSIKHLHHDNIAIHNANIIYQLSISTYC